MEIRLDFLIENYFVKLSSQLFYRDSHINPYLFVGYPPSLPRSRFLDVTQRSPFGGTLRDIQKKGCEGDAVIRHTELGVPVVYWSAALN